VSEGASMREVDATNPANLISTPTIVGVLRSYMNHRH
jgi:hypothetical protein